MAGDDKLWAAVAGPDGRARPLLAYSTATFQSCTAISRIALVVAQEKVAEARALIDEQRFDKVCAVVCGSARRQDSVRAGLDAISSCDYVVVHDGARPLVRVSDVRAGMRVVRPNQMQILRRNAFNGLRSGNGLLPLGDQLGAEARGLTISQQLGPDLQCKTFSES